MKRWTTQHRWIHLASILLVIAIMLAACAPKATGPLVVLEWSGYEQEVFWQQFADQHPDVKVEWTFFAEDAEAYAKLQSGFVADVTHPNYSWLQLYVDNDMLVPIDTSKMKSWSGVMEPLAKLGQVNGKQYMIPWEWGYDSITVRTDKVKKVPQSWADIWDPEYKGRVSMFDSAEAGILVGALALGIDPYTATPEQLQQIKQKLIELKPNLLGYWTDYTEINQQLISGEVWLGVNTWPDAYVAAKNEGIAVEYIKPKEGRIAWLYGFVIPKSSKNQALARDYIDAMVSVPSSVEMATQYGYGAANSAVVSQIDPEIVKLMELDNPNALNEAVFMKPLTEEQRKTWTTIWDEVKAAQ